MLRSRSMAIATALVFAICGTARAQMLSGRALADSLRQGGYVIVMRHASSPALPPDAATAAPDNTRHERQLDKAGKDSARAIGPALRTLGVRLGAVYSSPTYRARETARLAGLGTPKVEPELGDGGTSMSTRAVAGWADWLRAKVAARPLPGTNTILVTQYPNIRSAFPDDAKGLSDGEALVFQPDGRGAHVVAHVKISDWPKLAGLSK